MATTGPLPILLLPDGVLLGRANVVSVTSEANPYTAPGVASSSNLGDLIPQFVAVGLDANYALDLQIQRAGGTYSQAEWLWKNQTDAGTAWRGVDEIRYLDLPHDPFGQGGAHPALFKSSVMCAVNASKLGRIFLYLIGPSAQTIYARYRDAGDAPTVWTTSTFSVNGDPLKSGQAISMEVLEMADGTLRMIVVTGTDGATDNDVDVYTSLDGLTWALAARNVLSKAYSTTINCLKMRAAVSGDWIRMVVMDGTVPLTLRTFVSSDRCATFTYLSDANITGVGFAPEVNGNVVDPYGHIDVEGLGDAVGTFILVFRKTTNTFLSYGVGARDAEWAMGSTGLMNTTLDIYAACLVQDGTRLYAICATGSSVGGINIEASYAELDQAITQGVYAFATMFAPWDTYARYLPAFLTGVRTDPGFAILFGLVDLDTGPGNYVGSASGMLYGRQWTARSIWMHEQDKPPVGLFTNDFITLRWDTLTGLPNRAGAAIDPVRRHFGAFGSETWTADRTRLNSNATGATGRVYYAYNEGATGSWSTDGAYFGWTVGVLSTTISAVSDDRCAVRIRSLSTPAGLTYDLSVRHGPGQFVLYDNNAAAALLTIGVTAADKFYSVRLGIGTAGVTQAELMVAPVASMGFSSSWEGGAATIASGAGATFQGYEWGHITGQVGLSSFWRRMEHNAVGDCNQYGFTNPSKQRGQLCAAQPIYVTGGVSAFWSGGAGFESDNWTAEPRHTNEVDNLFLPSPQSYWAGSSMAGQSIVFTADPNNTAALLHHSGMAVFGTSTHRMTIEYNAANNWGAPSFTSAITNDLLPALRVTSSAGNGVLVAGVALDGREYVGKYARTVLAGNNVVSLRIARQVGQYLYLDVTGTIGATHAFSAGSSLWIHDDKFVVKYADEQRYAFMRVSFPAPTGTTTATLDVRAASMIAGPTLDFPAAINWAHTDSESPNVEMNEGVQGMRWGFEMGPSRRGIEASLLGDVDRNRRVLANHLRHLTKFGARPHVFAWDSDDLQRSAMLVRYEGSVTRENAGWRQRDDGTWYPIGNMKLAWSEEI